MYLINVECLPLSLWAAQEVREIVFTVAYAVLVAFTPPVLPTVTENQGPRYLQGRLRPHGGAILPDSMSFSAALTQGMEKNDYHDIALIQQISLQPLRRNLLSRGRQP